MTHFPPLDKLLTEAYMALKKLMKYAPSIIPLPIPIPMRMPQHHHHHAGQQRKHTVVVHRQEKFHEEPEMEESREAPTTTAAPMKQIFSGHHFASLGVDQGHSTNYILDDGW